LKGSYNANDAQDRSLHSTYHVYWAGTMAQLHAVVGRCFSRQSRRVLSYECE